MTPKYIKAISWMLKPLFGRHPTTIEVQYYYDTDKPKQEKFFSLEEKRKYRPTVEQKKQAKNILIQRKISIIKEDRRILAYLNMSDKAKAHRDKVMEKYKDQRFKENQVKIRSMIVWHNKTCTDIPSPLKKLFTKYQIYDII